MLMDILGVQIAFTSIILLLAIIVTSMVQFTQSTFKMRPRNLVTGVAVLLRMTESVARAGAPDKTDRVNARKLLNTLEAGNLRPAKNPEKWRSRVFGPTVSWIDQATFATAAKAANHGVNTTNLDQQFKVVEAAMEKRFLLWMRFVTCFWAVVIAFVFQVSTPDYLRDLWSNPEQRKELEAMAEGILADTTETVAILKRSSDEVLEESAAKALERLAAEYPQARARIEEASGVGNTKGYVVEELRLALEGEADRDRMLADYERFLDEENKQYAEDLTTAARDASVTLASMNIEPWSRKWEYYWKDGSLQLRHWAGVLLTALLLTLGAPFWFNALKSLVSLRDSMRKKLVDP